MDGWGAFMSVVVVTASALLIYWLGRYGKAALLKSFNFDIQAFEVEAWADEESDDRTRERLKNYAHSQQQAAQDERIMVWICGLVIIFIAAGAGAFIVERWP